MRNALRQAACVVVLTFAVIPGARAQGQQVPADVKAFAAKYVAAFNAKNLPGMLALSVPQSRACITPANKDMYDAMMAMQFSNPVTPNYVLSLLPVNENNMKALAAYESFPVKPEHELHIDYQYPGTNSGGLLVIWIARQSGRWMSVFPCMTAQGIKNFRDNAAARERYKAMAARIKEPLRSELIHMLRAHQIGEAEARYQKATGSDMRTAMLVVNFLQEQAQ